MASSDELRRLADRVEQASGPDRELDAAIASIIRLERVPDWARNWSGEWRPNELGSVVMMHADGAPGPHFMAREYTASLDAAMTVVPKGWVWTINTFPDRASAYALDAAMEQVRCDRAATPALALTVTALRARAAQSESNPHA